MNYNEKLQEFEKLSKQYREMQESEKINLVGRALRRELASLDAELREMERLRSEA